MSSHRNNFIAYLQKLADNKPDAMAKLRRSATYELGQDPDVFPIVEPLTNKSSRINDPYRIALYGSAALFATYSNHQPVSFAKSFGILRRERDNPSIETRFLSVLDSDSTQIFTRLRQAIQFLVADNYGLDYSQIIKDLAIWFDQDLDETNLSSIRQNWGIEFYKGAINERNTDSNDFVDYLIQLSNTDSWSASSARLRRSLAKKPGMDPNTFGIVEPWVDPDWRTNDPRRRARYLVAGLFGLHPIHDENQSFAYALNQLASDPQSNREGIERRFLALLDAPNDTIADHVRHILTRLVGTSIGYDVKKLLNDLSIWMRRTPNIKQLDIIRNQWAQDFYKISNRNERK